MNKKYRPIALAICLCALICSLCINSSADGYLTDEQVRDMEQRFSKRCEEILTAVNHKDYFVGGCTDWTSDQLKGNGIGYWYQGNYNCGFHDAHFWLEELDDGAVTETGFTQTKYYGASCLFDIVSEYGKYPVYNIVVCWEHGNGQWVNEGHVC